VGGEKDEKGRKHCFFEKSSKKLLLVRLRALSRAPAQIQESFLVLFFKKEPLSLVFHRYGLPLDARNVAGWLIEGRGTKRTPP
jgi:hypothetical protein